MIDILDRLLTERQLHEVSALSNTFNPVKVDVDTRAVPTDFGRRFQMITELHLGCDYFIDHGMSDRAQEQARQVSRRGIARILYREVITGLLAAMRAAAEGNQSKTMDILATLMNDCCGAPLITGGNAT